MVILYIGWIFSIIGFIITFIQAMNKRKDLKVPDKDILRVYDNTYMLWLIVMWIIVVGINIIKILGGQ
jgi:uncharacterized membrane protein